MIEKKIHVIGRIAVNNTPDMAAEILEREIKRLEDQGWRSTNNIFVFQNAVFLRMWREKK